jgi:signal transduction histidine kinase
MSRPQRHVLSIVAGLLMLGGLVALTVAQPPAPGALLAWLIFTPLFVFTVTFGFPLSVGNANLMPMIALGGLLVMGPAAAGWMAYAGSLIQMLVRWRFASQLGARREALGPLPVAGVGLANAAIISLSLLGAAWLYQALGGPLPLRAFSAALLLPFLLLVLAFSALNYLLAGAYIALLDGSAAALRTYARVLPQVVAYEVTPQAFTLLLPLIYLQLGAPMFVLFAALLVVGSLAARSLSLTSQRLKQRLAELDALGAMGQALAASLQRDGLLATLREQLPRVVPADGLYVALYDRDQDEVSFPLIVEEGQLLQWPSRRAGHGLTEHVLRTRQPLLVNDGLPAELKAMGVTPMGRPAASWLGVPLLAGSEALGVLVAQSFRPEGERFTTAHRDLLATIATQLAVALNNAYLYTQTDQALAQRVQQLSSILYTTGEGILLLDANSLVLTANRALAGFLNLPVAGLAGRLLSADQDLLARLGTTLADFQNDLEALRQGQDVVRHTHTLPGPPARSVERTLAAVRDAGGRTAGWLIVLRDVTEEQALQRLRDDLTHMLIHDLRSPLGSILTGLALVLQITQPDQPPEPDVFEVLRLAQTSGQHMLRLINQLLEIARLESGSVPLNRQPAVPAALIAAAAERLRPVADSAAIRLVVAAAPDLPSLPVDVELIGRVLDNLADNALKFSPDGTEVRLWTRADDHGDRVLFGVTDSGPGIAPADQAQLFQKFHAVPGVRGRRGGTGLGLAFCKLVVEAHHGQMTVESQPGQGATFVFSLPLDGTPGGL